MINLKAKSPIEGLLPVTHSNAVLRGVDVGAITSLMPYASQQKAASDALKVAHGMAFPAPGRATGRANCRAVWSGQGQAFLLGPKADMSLSETTAMTDQSDGWVVMMLEGGPMLYREYVERKADTVVLISKKVSAEEAAPIELFGCAHHCLGIAGDLSGKRVALCGLGPAGLAILSLMMLTPPKVL